MIRINLLPPEIRKEEGVKVAVPWRQFTTGAGILLVFVSGCLPMANKLQARTLAQLTQRWEELKPKRERLERVRASLRLLETRTQVVWALKSPEARWAPRLNLLSDALVSKLWFSRLKMVYGKEVELRGSTLVSESGEGAQVSQFLHRLKAHRQFDQWFSDLKLELVQHRKVSDVEVVDFEILLFPTG